MHWCPDPDEAALRRFLSRLIRLRQHLAALLNPELPLPDGPGRMGEAGSPWREWHGIELRNPDWASWSHSLAWSLVDPLRGPLLWCGMNAYYQGNEFELPFRAGGWLRVINTALPADQDLPETPQPWIGTKVPLVGRSLVLMLAPQLLEGLRLAPPDPGKK
jgi:glycogen operon protein